MEKKYFAIIGDIVESRAEANRGAVQTKLKAALDEVNRKFSDVIAADFLITLGDEFQGLLFAETETKAIFIAALIIMRMYPVRLRISVGLGSMSTKIDRSAAIGADGEAFYRARRGMLAVRKEERTPRSAIYAVTGDEKTEIAVNTVLGLCFTLSRDWTRRQAQIGFMYAESRIFNEGFTQQQIAEEIGITQGTVNISLKSSEAYSFAKGLCAAQFLLERCVEI